MLLRRTAASFVLALSLPGCAHGFAGGFHFGAVFAHAPAAIGHIAVAPVHVAVASAHVAVAATPAVAAAIAAPRAYPAFVVERRDAPSAEPPPAPEDPAPRKAFDVRAARTSLEHLDLEACRSAGLPRGWLHGRVTFANDGQAARVEIDAPAGEKDYSPSAVACVGKGLSHASMPPFTGDGQFPVGVTRFVP